jgi:hypothetical protein
MAPDVNSLFSKALAYFAFAMEALLKGRLSTVDLLIRIGFLVKTGEYHYNVKSS